MDVHVDGALISLVCAGRRLSHKEVWQSRFNSVRQLPALQQTEHRILYSDMLRNGNAGNSIRF